MIMDTADAILHTLQSPNVCDSNFEAANVVDVINQLANATNRIANAITPTGIAGGKDAAGGHVESLTEAVMGMTGGMIKIAKAIESLADAMRGVKFDYPTNPERSSLRSGQPIGGHREPIES